MVPASAATIVIMIARNRMRQPLKIALCGFAPRPATQSQNHSSWHFVQKETALLIKSIIMTSRGGGLKFGGTTLGYLYPLLLFSVQQGCTSIGNPTSWVFATISFSMVGLGTLLAIWFWEGTSKHNWPRKILASFITVASMIWLIYGPITRQYAAEHPDDTLQSNDENRIIADTSLGPSDLGDSQQIFGVKWMAQYYTDLRVVLTNVSQVDIKDLTVYVQSPGNTFVGASQISEVTGVDARLVAGERLAGTVMQGNLSYTDKKSHAKKVIVMPAKYSLAPEVRIHSESLGRGDTIIVAVPVCRLRSIVNFQKGQSMFLPKAPVRIVFGEGTYLNPMRPGQLREFQFSRDMSFGADNEQNYYRPVSSISAWPDGLDSPFVEQEQGDIHGR